LVEYSIAGGHQSFVAAHDQPSTAVTSMVEPLKPEAEQQQQFQPKRTFKSLRKVQAKSLQI